MVFPDGGPAPSVVGVGRLEGVAQVGLGEHLGPVDRLRHQHGVGGRGGGGGRGLRPGGGRVVAGAGARLLPAV